MNLSFSISPCSNPEMGLEDVLAHYGQLGYTRFELFTGWVKSAVNTDTDPEAYLNIACKHGFEFSSIHLPPLSDDLESSIVRAEETCQLGVALGCRVAIVKASSKANYIHGGKELLERVETLPIIPVLTNHAGTAISTLGDYREVIDGIQDPRMKYLLEIGHFHSVGVSWREGYDLLAGCIELVHIKDQVGKQSVRFGTGEIDLTGLFSRLIEDDYRGDVVIEMEVADRENTLHYLKQALDYVKERT